MAGAELTNRVFINCPFDKSYSRLFLSQIAALVCLSRTPRCALELPDDGRGRLHRLLELIKSCEVSVHDLSKVGTPVRFNMPFELGLACAIANEFAEGHTFCVLERMPNRLDRTLSDLKFIDPIIHAGSHIKLINGFVDAFPVRRRSVDSHEIHNVASSLFQKVETYRRRNRISSQFTRRIFEFSVAMSAELAASRGLIDA